MKAFLIAAIVINMATLTRCGGPTGSSVLDQVAAYDGAVLRVRYPTDGNQDIFIFVDNDGSVDAVTGGATSVSSFKLTRSRLQFNADAVTLLGHQPMRFTLDAVAEGSWVGEYRVGGNCKLNCVRTGAASWEKGGDQVNLIDG